MEEEKVSRIAIILSIIFPTLIPTLLVILAIFASLFLVIMVNIVLDNFFGENMEVYTWLNKGLGSVSAYFEGRGGPGTIADNKGDIGGKSYGSFQLASEKSSIKNFLKWLKKNDTKIYKRLNEAFKADGKIAGENFDKEWIDIAEENSNEFYDLQRGFIKEKYYDEVDKYLSDKYSINIEEKSRALQESVWSTSVQHGTGGACGIFDTLHSDGVLEKSDREIIKALYKERSKVNIYFKSSSAEIKESVKNRFKEELELVLSILYAEENALSGAGDMTWPVPGWRGIDNITSKFGNRTHPIYHDVRFHSGIDIRGGLGDNIVAVESGEVEWIKDAGNSGYGKYFQINHGEGVATLYAHCNKILVKTGDIVEKGETVAEVGSSGSSTGFHLHFEVLVDGQAVDPLHYLDVEE